MGDGNCRRQFGSCFCKTARSKKGAAQSGKKSVSKDRVKAYVEKIKKADNRASDEVHARTRESGAGEHGAVAEPVRAGARRDSDDRAQLGAGARRAEGRGDESAGRDREGYKYRGEVCVEVDNQLQNLVHDW